MSAGRRTVSLKLDYLQRYRIPARMFNALRVSLEGKVAPVKEQQLLRRDELQRRIARAQGQISLAGAGGWRGRLHQKRWLGNLKAKLEKLESDIDSGGTALLWFQEVVAEAVQLGSQRLYQSR